MGFINSFEGNQFAIQVIAKGSYTDDGCGGGRTFLVNTTVIRLNHIALNAWIASVELNDRECYETDEEWKSYKADIVNRHKKVEKQIIDALNIDFEPKTGKPYISQTQSEIFTVVHIVDTTPAKKLNKEEFFNTNLGRELIFTLRALDSDLEKRKKAVDYEDASKAQEKIDRGLAQLDVFRWSIKQFYGKEYQFSRTEDFYGMVEDINGEYGNWLIKINRE